MTNNQQRQEQQQRHGWNSSRYSIEQKHRQGWNSSKYRKGINCRDKDRTAADTGTE
jgi:hypothetical protein